MSLEIKLLLLFLCGLVLALLIALFIQTRMLRNYRDFLWNIHTAIGLSFYKKLDIATFMDQLKRLSEKKDFSIPQTNTERVYEFFSEETERCYTYLHATFDKLTADSILREGFKFEESLYKTTQKISSEIVDLKYKVQLCKQHGNFLILICIPQELYVFIVKEILSKRNGQLMESYICEKIEEDNLNFLLPKVFIKGYTNFITNEITVNPDFLKGYDAEIFRKNLMKNLPHD
jgi:hypothetical protein